MIRKEILKKVKDTSSIVVGDIVTLSSDQVVLGERRYLQGRVEEVVSDTLLKIRPEVAINVYSDDFQYVDVNKVLVKQKNRLEKKQRSWRKNISGPPEQFNQASITDV